MTIPQDTTPLAALIAQSQAQEGARRKGALHANVVSQLRNLIVTGVLPPGAKLNERELCEQLAVSRTPVREAIKTLIQDGLLRSLPNHSAVVSDLDLEHINALIDVVSVIEGLAGELAARNASDEAVAEIGLLHYRMLLHHARDELPGYFEANKAFHRKIVELAGNPVLLSVWDMLALRVDRARYSSNLWPKRWKTAIQEHQLILDALSTRDPQRAGEALRQHVRNGLTGLVAALSEGRATAAENAPEGRNGG
ncbi:MAG: GntR family transcriptional regulator [Chelatococcus sp.]|nr:MAG: GntR family transcriptional regulator [Chelatococcus sp.]